MDYEELRQSFRPAAVKILFVGESVPASGKFFYAQDSILFSATRESFLNVFPSMRPATFLGAFRDMGCYLEDLCPLAVNNLDDLSRTTARIRSLPGFTERFTRLSPAIVIAVMREIAPYVQQAMDSARSEAPLYTLPFPRSEHRTKYVAELTKLLRAFCASDILAP